MKNNSSNHSNQMFSANALIPFLTASTMINIVPAVFTCTAMPDKEAFSFFGFKV